MAPGRVNLLESVIKAVRNVRALRLGCLLAVWAAWQHYSAIAALSLATETAKSQICEDA